MITDGGVDVTIIWVIKKYSRKGAGNGNAVDTHKWKGYGQVSGNRARYRAFDSRIVNFLPGNAIIMTCARRGNGNLVIGTNTRVVGFPRGDEGLPCCVGCPKKQNERAEIFH